MPYGFGFQVTIESQLATTVKTTIVPSNRVLQALSAGAKAQVKVKALTAYLQIAVNISFNCGVAYPANFTSFLDGVKVINVDLIPALGLQCEYNGFDYVHKMVRARFYAPLIFVLGVT